VSQAGGRPPLWHYSVPSRIDALLDHLELLRRRIGRMAAQAFLVELGRRIEPAGRNSLCAVRMWR
jgi:hypothetical protein